MLICALKALGSGGSQFGFYPVIIKDILFSWDKEYLILKTIRPFLGIATLNLVPWPDHSNYVKHEAKHAVSVLSSLLKIPEPVFKVLHISWWQIAGRNWFSHTSDFTRILFKSVQRTFFLVILELPNIVTPAKPNGLSDKGK